MIQSTAPKRFEILKLSKSESVPKEQSSELSKRDIIAKRAAKEFKSGMIVNLGVGIPTLSANYVPSDIGVTLHCENGLLGTGPYPESETVADPDLINAG